MQARSALARLALAQHLNQLGSMYLCCAGARKTYVEAEALGSFYLGRAS